MTGEHMQKLMDEAAAAKEALDEYMTNNGPIHKRIPRSEKSDGPTLKSKRDMKELQEDPIVPDEMKKGIERRQRKRNAESEERRKLWMRCYRSRQPAASNRKRRVVTVPGDLELAMQSQPENVGALFDLWVGDAQDWARVHVYVKKWKKKFTDTSITKRWMTKAQVKAHFIEQEVADAVCAAAEMRKNIDPALAKLETANQYHITIFDDTLQCEEQGEEGGI